MVFSFLFFVQSTQEGCLCPRRSAGKPECLLASKQSWQCSWNPEPPLACSSCSRGPGPSGPPRSRSKSRGSLESCRGVPPLVAWWPFFHFPAKRHNKLHLRIIFRGGKRKMKSYVSHKCTRNRHPATGAMHQLPPTSYLDERRYCRLSSAP